MSELSVSERRIKPIHDAIEGENWKQALQICEKWQKKGEKSDHFQVRTLSARVAPSSVTEIAPKAVKAFVLGKQQDAATRQRGIEETISLCRRDPAITDLAALHRIQDSLKDLSLSAEEGTKLWDRAIAAKPGDKDLAMTWLNRSIVENNWPGAQKAAMALRKGFPKERNYDFWNILMCYLTHKDPSRPEKERMLLGTLAYRLISKAAEALPADKNQLLSSGKAIQTPEELYLLVKIYLGTGHARETVELLQSDTFGLKSRFAEQDPQLISALLLESFEAAEAWPEAFAHCENTLLQHQHEEHGTPDDGKLWMLLVRAAKGAEDPDRLQKGKTLITNTLKMYGNLRPAHQALLAIIQAQGSSTDTYDELYRACEDYWQRFRRKAYCFEDIRNSLSALDQQRQGKFLEQLSSEKPEDEVGDTNGASDSTTPVLNLLKLRYCFSLPVGVPEELLESFACDALRLYRTSLDGSSQCPEAALLAAMALVRLAFTGLAEAQSAPRYDQHLLQAVFILEACRTRIKEYYPYSLLLLQIKSLLGLISLAMTDFKGLNIKNIQWETTGHLLLTRISTSHPRAVGSLAPSEDTGIEPLRAFAASLFMSQSSGETLSAQIRSGLKNGSYVNVIESVDLRSHLENSLNKHIAIQEEARIKQLLSVPDVEDIPLRPSYLVDNRDFSYLPSYEAEGAPAFEQYLRPGPIPGERWLAAMTLYNQTIRFLRGELYGHRAPSTNEIELFQTALAASTDAHVKELTDVELNNLKVHISLANAVVAMKRPSESERVGLNQHITDIENWLREESRHAENIPWADAESTNERYTLHLGSSVMVHAPSWTYLHWAFSLLETLQGISLVLATLSTKSKAKPNKSNSQAGLIAKDKIADVQKLVEQVETSLHDSARKLKSELNAPGILGKLMDVGLGRDEEKDEQSPVGRVLEELADATSLEVLCGDMKESWEDALDGILAIKVKAK